MKAEKLAKSEIFQADDGPMGPVISERASRPLISESDPDVRQETVHQIVKVAEAKRGEEVASLEEVLNRSEPCAFCLAIMQREKSR